MRGTFARVGAKQMIKVIRSKTDYEAALSAVTALAALDPAPGTADGDRLEVLGVLLEDYENRTIPRTLPTPLEALRFRMEQESLQPRDLIPFLGSRSKVSEVLAGKRRLTLSMIRALHSGLGIPAAVLLQEAPQTMGTAEVEWEKFPVQEMVRRGWLGKEALKKGMAVDALRGFFAPVGAPMAVNALYKGTRHVRSARQMDPYALTAWTTRVMIRAASDPLEEAYDADAVTPDFLREVARLSWAERGPALAKEYLGRHGIALIAEPHLPKTHLDGAALLRPSGAPVVALTLRFDRLDNFWFVLMHELAHICLHYESGVGEFYDDLESPDDDQREREADELAGESLVPDEIWQKSPASRLRTEGAALHLAKQLNVHPAIVAGRMRHHFGEYRILNRLVGQGEVRKWFDEDTDKELW